MTKRKSSSLLKNNGFRTLAFIFLIAISPVLLILISTSFRNMIIGIIAGILNTLVLSNIFFCNLVVIGILSFAILIVIYIYSRIK